MDVVNDATLTAAVAQAWAESRDLLRERVAVLEATALAVLDGTLSVERRAHAEREAHKLAGALGSFGLVASSRRGGGGAWVLRGGGSPRATQGLRASEVGVGPPGQGARGAPRTGGPRAGGGSGP